MNDRYGWDDRDRHDQNWRERYRRHSAEGSHRSSYADSDRGQNRGSSDRWRSEEDDWSPRGYDQGRSDFDREQRFGGSGTFGYGEARAGHGERQVGGYGGSSYGAGSQQSYASQADQRRYSSSDYGYGGGYGAGQQNAGGQQPYFTGQQQAWEVPSSYGAPGTFGSSYGGGTGTYGGGAGGSQGYGEDYRDHGYASRQHERGFLQRAGDEVASWFGDEDAARRREQDHRGRGPADYTRSDERIREDANDRLTEDWRVDASRISVTVENGEITLSGTVTRREDKRRAEDIVEDLSGVKHVQNNLRVDQQAAWSGSSGTTTGTGSASTFGSSSTGAATAAGKTKLEPPQT
jgi:osmotically-inducible protein OsmY